MKRLLLDNMRLTEGNLPSKEEKTRIVGGYDPTNYCMCPNHYEFCEAPFDMPCEEYCQIVGRGECVPI